MNPTRLLAAVLLAAGVCTLSPAHAQLPGLGRTDVLRGDLGSGAHEVVQARVDFPRGAASARHSHPGEEVAYVLEGTLEYRLDGRAPVTLHVGESLLIPAGVNHVATNVGEGKAVELATYLLPKGKPLFKLADH